MALLRSSAWARIKARGVPGPCETAPSECNPLNGGVLDAETSANPKDSGGNVLPAGRQNCHRNGSTPCQVRRRISSFFMRAWSVVRLRPRIFAAPRSPLICQPVSSDVGRLATRSTAAPSAKRQGPRHRMRPRGQRLGMTHGTAGQLHPCEPPGHVSIPRPP